VSEEGRKEGRKKERPEGEKNRKLQRFRMKPGLESF